MFKFIINETGKFHLGSLSYNKGENSFDFVPSRNADITLLVGYVNIGVDSETMTVQQIWGLHPYEGWIQETLNNPCFIEGELIVEEDIQLGIIDWMEVKDRLQNLIRKQDGFVLEKVKQ